MKDLELQDNWFTKILHYFGIFSKRYLNIIHKDFVNSIASWSDWFISSHGNTISNSYSSPISLNQNTQVLFCVFLDIVSSINLSDGSSSDISLLVEECSFVNCYCFDYGGGIYFYDGSNCVLNKLCGYQCNTTSGKWGQFCYIRVKLGSEYKNVAHHVSVCLCAQYENIDRHCSVSFYYGNISFNNVNSSANRCREYSGVIFITPCISYASQSTFSNNTDGVYRDIYFHGNTQDMSQCNIIRNHQKSISYGTFFNWYAITTLSNCIIYMNTGAPNLIYVKTGSVTLQNCYIQSNMQPIGNVNTQSTLSDSDSLVLLHFHSQMCLTLIHKVGDDVNALTSNMIFNISLNMFDIIVLLFTS